jgi:hypothetical protein
MFSRLRPCLPGQKVDRINTGYVDQLSLHYPASEHTKGFRACFLTPLQARRDRVVVSSQMISDCHCEYSSFFALMAGLEQWRCPFLFGIGLFDIGFGTASPPHVLVRVFVQVYFILRLT